MKIRFSPKEKRMIFTAWSSDFDCLSEATIYASHATLRLGIDTVTRKPPDAIQIRRMR